MVEHDNSAVDQIAEDFKRSKAAGRAYARSWRERLKGWTERERNMALEAVNFHVARTHAIDSPKDPGARYALFSRDPYALPQILLLNVDTLGRAISDDRRGEGVPVLRDATLDEISTLVKQGAWRTPKNPVDGKHYGVALSTLDKRLKAARTNREAGEIMLARIHGGWRPSGKSSAGNKSSRMITVIFQNTAQIAAILDDWREASGWTPAPLQTKAEPTMTKPEAQSEKNDVGSVIREVVSIQQSAKPEPKPQPKSEPAPVLHLPRAPVPDIPDVIDSQLRELLDAVVKSGLSMGDAAAQILAAAETLCVDIEDQRPTYQIVMGRDVLEEITADTAELAGAIYATSNYYPTLAALCAARRVEITVRRVDD